MELNLSRIKLPNSLTFKPWRLLGFGLYQAWVYLALFSTTLFSDEAIFSENLSFTRQYFSLSLSICFFILVLVAYRLNIMGRRKYLLILGACTTLVGTFIIATPSLVGVSSTALILVGITCTSIGNSILIMCWGILWYNIAVDRMAMHIMVSNVFAGLVYTLIISLPLPFAIIAMSLLPLLSGITLLSCNDEPQRKRSLPKNQSPSLIFKALAIIAIIPFVYGICRAISATDMGANFDITYHKVVFGITIFAFILLAVSLFTSHERIILRLYKLIVPMMVIGYMAYSFIDPSLRWVAISAIACGFYSFEGLVWLLHPQLKVKLGSSDLVAFGWGRALFHVCGFLGSVVGFWLVNKGFTEGAPLEVVCLAIVVIVIFTTTYAFSEHDLYLFIEPAGITPVNDLTQLCEAISQHYGLSNRESEILVLLAKGRSVPFIAEEFVVSKGTVKTHVNHIYKKLDIHSRQELLDLIESQKSH